MKEGTGIVRTRDHHATSTTSAAVHAMSTSDKVEGIFQPKSGSLYVFRPNYNQILCIQWVAMQLH